MQDDRSKWKDATESETAQAPGTLENSQKRRTGLQAVITSSLVVQYILCLRNSVWLHFLRQPQKHDSPTLFVRIWEPPLWRATRSGWCAARRRIIRVGAVLPNATATGFLNVQRWRINLFGKVGVQFASCSAANRSCNSLEVTYCVVVVMQIASG